MLSCPPPALPLLPPNPILLCCSGIPALVLAQPHEVRGGSADPLWALDAAATSQHCQNSLGLGQGRNTETMDFAQEQQEFMSKHKEHNKNTARIGLQSFLTFSGKPGMETCLLQGRRELRNKKSIYCCVMQHLAL